MSIPTPMYRDLFLCEEVSAESVKSIINSIFVINNDDDLKEKEYKDWERVPIRLFINSPGGVVYDGLSLVDVIKRSKTPVYTIAIGQAMSMGLWIFEAGEKRLVGENATLMWHDLVGGSYTKTEGIKQELDECLRLQKKSIESITKRSLIKEETLQDYINRKAEWYISAEEAIELHLADEFYK